MPDTSKQYDEVMAQCRELFVRKMADYGPSWRINQPSTITDQIFINAKRIRTILINGKSAVDEDIYSEYVGIINYGIIGMIQLDYGFSDTIDMTAERALELYDHYAALTKGLMMAKNTDYGEAWRQMRISSMVDLILMKLLRIKQIEDNNGRTEVSEGPEGGYRDIVNYSLFCLVRLNNED